MEKLEAKKQRDIEIKLSLAKHLHQGLLPIFHTVDRRKKNLELEISILEKELQKLLQGQLVMKFDKEL